MSKKVKQIDEEIAFGEDRNDHRWFLDTWNQHGFNTPTQEQYTIRDLLATSNARVWLPKTIETIARDPVEPMTIIPSLLDRISVDPGTVISIPSLGALRAFEIPEAGPYPEQTLNVTPGTITANTGKVGLSFSITEEMLNNSQFDLINMHIRAGRQAMDREKEVRGMTYLTGMGVSLFDNKSPTTSIHGVCTGRSLVGAANGSCRAEDLLKGYAHIMMQGYVPNTIIMHPLAWSMWMIDPILQTIVKNTGNGAWFQRANMAKQALFSSNKTALSGSYGQYTPPSNAASATPTEAVKLDQNLQSAAVVPNYFPYPLNVVVTPFAPYYVHNNTCDIMLLDGSNAGALIVESDVQVDQWEDLSVDVLRVKMKERYGFYIYEDGLAIGVFRNVPIVANEIALPAQANISVSGSLSAIPAGTAISGI